MVAAAAADAAAVPQIVYTEDGTAIFTQGSRQVVLPSSEYMWQTYSDEPGAY